ncbi:hypothetical protein [Streptomyces sp. NPDC058424]|uniref:hypothetical protein n=1 Tax=Streptomyces sp. NPDC058424 TaxID=3346491 RepID=UPI00364C48E3
MKTSATPRPEPVPWIRTVVSSSYADSSYTPRRWKEAVALDAAPDGFAYHRLYNRWGAVLHTPPAVG